MTTGWILDSGGAGRGAWQGGVIYEFMGWCRENACYPGVSMGASAGGYAAADVATGTERTVMKGWSRWGMDDLLRRYPPPAEAGRLRLQSRFRRHLYASICYVMAEEEVRNVFDAGAARKLLIFTTRVRRRDGHPLGGRDRLRLFLQSATRKLPASLKYLPAMYAQDPVIFASHLPDELCSEFVRPLTRRNYHGVIEASCLVPLAMGLPLPPDAIHPDPGEGGLPHYPGDQGAQFIDGGYTLKMPMALFEEDPRFRALGHWAAADKIVVFCCDPKGRLWETSSRLRALNDRPAVRRAVAEGRLLLIYPDHQVEAGFLCVENARTLRTFERGREQGRRLLAAERVRRFLSS